MKGRSASKIKLTSYDELLGGGEETNDIQQVSLEHLHSFENHPFQVNDDEAMAELERADRQREWLEQGKRMGKQEGLERGELCKVIKQVLKNMKKGKPISEIAEILDEDETLIRQIFICHEEHPDWTADQIAKLFIKMKS